MDSSETRNDVIAPNSSDSAPLQDSTSTIFSYISDLSPIKPSKGAVVAPSFPELGYPPQVFTSPGINPQSQSGSFKRPQYHHLSSEYSKRYDDKNDDIAPVICTSGKVNADFSYQVNSHGIGHSINGSAHGKGGITSQYVDEYLADLLKVDSDDAGNAANSSLKQSDIGTPSFKDFADCINYNSMNGEQHNVHVRTELQESTQTSQLHTCGGEPAGVISTEQNDLLHDSEASQQMFGVPRCCLQYDESQQDAVAKICGSSSQSKAASILRSSSSKTQVLESSSAAIYAPLNNLELENSYKPILSTLHTPKFGKSSLAVSKPLGIGLHLNSIVNALPMGCGATLKSADKDYMIVQGKKSFCTTDSHPSENAGNSSTSSKAVDGILKPSEHHSTACDNGEYTKLSPQKKRKRSTGSSDGDGCKRCNCKKTKCLKLYCDCFASGYYCAQTCSCQGCFNTPEYEDTVLETRRQIVSRDPLAFAPKILQRVGESPANSIQDINKSTPSSARHKRGCNCKKSMCLKRYCECYQSNIGCSDGCRCAGCKNVYGKKEECGSSKHIANTEATNDIPEISPDQKLDTISHSELSIPHYMTSFTPLFWYTECGELPGADVALSATHERPSNSTKSSDNHKMIEETCQTIPDLLSSDLQLYDCNSKRVDDSSPHRCRSNSLSIHHDRRPVAVACITSQTTEVMTNDTSSQPCPESGSFSLLSSRKLSSSPITSAVPFGENKLPMVLDSDSRCYNILEDDDIPEILNEQSISYSGVKVRSPNKKRVSPPHSRFHELRPSSSITGLRSGRKYILKAVPSFPPLAPCINVKSTSSPSTDAPNSRNKND